MAYFGAMPKAQPQDAAPSPERAQDQPRFEDTPFSLLPGFRIDRVTLPTMTDSYIVITFDAQGRPVVGQSSSGNGSHPRLLVDSDNDGVYDTERILSYQLNTCHGLFFEGTTLYAACRGTRVENIDGPYVPPPADGGGRGGGGGRGNATPDISGFFKLEDRDGDDYYETIERITRYVSAGMGDHGPHAIRRGADGGIWHMIGNNTFVPDSFIDAAGSPNFQNFRERQFLPAYDDPSFGNSVREGVHGTVFRFNELSHSFSIQSTGLRNSYDFAFNLEGDYFTFDSDMEWDVNLPWYREVRTAHLFPGSDNGYRDGSGKYQDEYFDTIPAVRHLRRGSPVGVETYQSYAYPSSFFDALFEADWSRGRLLYTALTQNGGTYSGRDDLGEFVHGEPMPITDLEVGPDGNIYFTTGGGNGTGGLYKVSWTGEAPVQPDMTGILAVVRQPQPLSSWGWAAIEQVKADMGDDAFASALEGVARSTSATPMDRMRAVLELQRHGPEPSPELLQTAMNDADYRVRSAAVYAAGIQVANIGRTGTTDPNRGASQTVTALHAVAASALDDAHPLVRRRAAEALVTMGMNPRSEAFAPVADIYALLSDPDRIVRYSGRIALEHTPRLEWAGRALQEQNVVGFTEGVLALVNTGAAPNEISSIYDRLVTLMGQRNMNADETIRVLRAFEITATEAPGGAPADVRRRASAALISRFPTANPLINRHMAKVLAYTAQNASSASETIGELLAAMPQGEENQPEQIEYIYALRTIRTGWTSAQKRQVIDWFAKAQDWRGGARFSGYLQFLFDAMMDVMDDNEKQMAYAAAPLFAPLTPEMLQAAAAARAGGPARGGGGGGGGGGRGGRGTPLNTQERYDNLVFPRGGGPGVLSGRGGAPSATAGQQVFADNCASCHMFGGNGNNYGPNLTNIAETMGRREVLRAIFFPNEQVADEYRTTVVQTTDNRTIRGLVVNETDAALSLKTAADPQPVTIQKSQISSRTMEATSIMPEDLIDNIGGDMNIQNVALYLLNEGE